MSQARERLTARPQLAAGLGLAALDGSAHNDVVTLDPFGVSVLRLDDGSARPG